MNNFYNMGKNKPMSFLGKGSARVRQDLCSHHQGSVMLCSLKGSPGSLCGWAAQVPAPMLPEDWAPPTTVRDMPLAGTQELPQRYQLSQAHLLNP